MSTPPNSDPTTQLGTDENDLPLDRLNNYRPDHTKLSDQDRKAMQDMLDSEAIPIPEHLFIKYLLPLTYIPSDDPDENIQRWRRMTGSLTGELRVMSPSGELLFISPGLYPDMMLFADRTGKSMRWTELVASAIQHNDIHPGLGEEHLDQIGSQALPTLDNDEHLAHRKRWEEVWTRYNVNGFGTSSTTTEKPGVVDNSETPEQMEEDDEI